MCGICGFSGKEDRTLLKKMCDLIKYRGPDDDGFYSDGRMNLGMRRLSIIDLETGHQPISNESRDIWIVFNGEIYNFKELRPDLEEKGHKFTTSTDTEVIIHLYEEHGLDFVHRLNGMFAIAIWDMKKDSLILVRDRVGVKPLHYALVANQLIFGSEIKTILAHPAMKKEMDFTSVSDYLTFKNIPPPRTIYKNIFSLRPGELAVFSKGRYKLDKYWTVQFKENDYYTEEDIADRILELLKDAVRYRMISDVPVGAFLSGGVDSSLIVSLMTELANKKIKTFSLAYDEKLDTKTDAYYAKKMSLLFGTEHYEYVMPAEELPEKLDNIVEHLEQPFSGVISTYFLTQLVKKHVKVALSGDGADDQFGSYAHHRLTWPIHNYQIALQKGFGEDTVDFRPYTERMDFVKETAEPELWSWRIKFYAFSEEEKRYHLMSGVLKERVGHHSSLEVLKGYFETFGGGDPLNKILAVDVNTLLPNDILTFVDRLSMAHSVEVRGPYLDYRFVEFAATIPGRFKIKDGISKYILKKAALQRLPQEIIDRKKEGFILPLDKWFLGRMKGFVRGLLSPERINRHGFFNNEYVANIMESHFAGRKDNAYKIWTLVMFQMWYERYMACTY